MLRRSPYIRVIIQSLTMVAGNNKQCIGIPLHLSQLEHEITNIVGYLPDRPKCPTHQFDKFGARIIIIEFSNRGIIKGIQILGSN